jgi:hypothetical protein
MGGFGSALGDLLSGFHDVKRIDKEGFDWREERDHAEQLRRQQEEDYATKAATEASVGGVEDSELASMIPGQVNQARVMARARGAGLQQKSALADRAAYNAQVLQGIRGTQRLGEIGAKVEAAVPGREDTQQHQMDMLEQRLALAEREGTLDREMARTLADIRASKGGAGGAGKWAWDNETNGSVWVTPEQLTGAPPGKYSDVTTGRQGAAGASASQATTTLIDNADRALSRYEKLNSGWGRMVPAALSGPKAVAWDAYLTSLQTMAQMMGRTILGDNRVSDQDRVQYANAIGSTSQIINALDPTEARRRLDLLKELQTDYNSKYGGVPQTGGAPPPPGGALAPLRGAGGSSGRKYGVRPAGGN